MTERHNSKGIAAEAEWFRSAFATAAVGMAQLSHEGRWLRVNPRLCALAGRGETELLRQTLADLCHPDDLPLWQEQLHCAQSGAQAAIELDLRWLRPDGEVSRVHVSAAPAPDGFMVTAVDMQRWYSAEQERCNSERRFHSLTTAMAEIVWRADPLDPNTEALPSWENFTGLDAGEVVGMEWLRIVHPDDREQAAQAWRRAMRSNQPYYVEYRLRRHDGAWRLMAVRGVPIVNADGSVQEWVGVCIDITERRQHEQEISNLNEQLRHLIEVVQRLAGARSLEELATTVCTAARLLAVSDGASFALREYDNIRYICEDMLEPVFGKSSVPLDQCVGGCSIRQAKPITVPDIALERRSYAATYRPTFVKSLVSVPVRMLDPLGAIGVYWAQPHQPSEREMQMLRTLADATAIALENIRHYDLLEQRVEERTAQLEAASRAKSQFLSSMSHELRTPLNAVLGFAQLLETECGQAPRMLENIVHIQKAGWHLLELINEVLDLARIETGAIRLSVENVDLHELVAETLLLIGPTAAAQQITVHAAGDKNCNSQVLADRTRLRQVLLNLLTNAVKYNRAGGSVTLSWDYGGGGYLRIAVTDTGPGLSAEQCGHLFEAFNRLGRETENIEGTGIGLVITKRLVEAMGGRIGVQSMLGTGSTFWIELKIAGSAVRTAALHVDDIRAAGPTQPCTLLYVEDNPVNLLLVAKLLEAQPLLHMLSANTGRTGIEMARAYQPDLVVLDIGLPDMSGIEVLHELRADQRTRAIPVLALSAHAAHSDIQQALAAGAQRYVTKPIRVKEFLDAIYQCLR